MKMIAFLSTTIFFLNSGTGQEATPLPNLNGSAKPTMVYIRDLAGKPLPGSRNIDIEGSPFLNNEFEPGRVVFTNGKMSSDLYLQFNMVDNKLLFRRDDMIMEFVDSVRDFYLQYNENNTLGLVFRCNFPPIDRNTRATFYELLVDGKIELLKYRYKTITGHREYNATNKKSYSEGSQLYAALPGNKIIRIKRDRNFLMRAMPDYAEKIFKLTNNLRLKDDESLINLFQELNK
ncbi:MAG: hypothetical protein EOP48_32700 [Sphingobacteriales bacterium]|nr:MAG: hypothetical protein EOP48_32700 [Sphingobacteriales bacterium]